jgi:hypothetical protein
MAVLREGPLIRQLELLHNPRHTGQPFTFNPPSCFLLTRFLSTGSSWADFQAALSSAFK